MRKQLFCVKRKMNKMKNRRQTRSFFHSFIKVDWIFNLSEGKGVKQVKERKQRPPAKQSKVNTVLAIAKHRAKDIPSDFFQVVTSSDIEHSPFSGKTSRIVNKVKSNIIKNEKVSNKGNKSGKRNYKQRKTLFNSLSSVSWAGTLTDSRGSTCPAYLITPHHALTSGGCALSTVTASLSVIFSVYRVTVTRVTLHCGMSDGCDLAMLTLHSPLPHSVGPVCYPAEYVGTLLGISAGDSVGDWMAQAIRGKP